VTTQKSTTTPDLATTTSSCPNQCCSNEECEDGEICDESGNCVPEGECDAERPCEGANEICNVPEYDNCQYCDVEAHPTECKPGCESDINCGTGQHCISHICEDSPGVNGIVNITISTETCSQCAGSADPFGVLEGGVRVHFEGAWGTACTSNNLDNLELVDYDNGKVAFFDGKPDNDGDDDGMGGCKGADLNYDLLGGTATWTGEGTWTGNSISPICIKFYDPQNNKPTCCCNLVKRTLTQGETSDLDQCNCIV